MVGNGHLVSQSLPQLVILTCEAADRQRWLRGVLGEGAVPPAGARGWTDETWTPSAATHLQMTVLQLRVEGEEEVRQHFQQDT